MFFFDDPERPVRLADGTPVTRTEFERLCAIKVNIEQGNYSDDLTDLDQAHLEWGRWLYEHGKLDEGV